MHGRDTAALITMASEEEREDLSDQEESVSETESSEGSDAGRADAEPVVVAAQHNYNLRPKRGLPDSVAGAAQTNKNEVAPGVGVEANKVPAGATMATQPRGRMATFALRFRPWKRTELI